MFPDETKLTLTVELTVRKQDVDAIKEYMFRDTDNGWRTIALLAGHAPFLIGGIRTSAVSD